MERSQAERALPDTAGRMALALAAGAMGTWVWDAATDRHVWDDTQARLFARPPGWAPAGRRAFLALIHPEDRSVLERSDQDGDGKIDRSFLAAPAGKSEAILRGGRACAQP